MFWIVALLVALPFGIVLSRGSPYLRTLKANRQTVFELAGLKEGDLFVDLGSGDGAMLIEAAKRGYRAVGYEINPFLWIVSRIRTLKYRNLVQIRMRDFWGQELPQDTKLLFVFLQDQFMPRLVQKLKKEAPKGMRVASFNFKIPDSKVSRSSNNIYLYKF